MWWYEIGIIPLAHFPKCSNFFEKLCGPFANILIGLMEEISEYSRYTENRL